MKNQLLDFMAKACHYAQSHIGDADAWSMDDYHRERMLQCVSFQMACFLSQNTVNGHAGVDWDVVIDELTGINPPVLSVQEWEKILQRRAKELGGWKNHGNS